MTNSNTILIPAGQTQDPADATYIIFDTETTGLPAKGHVSLDKQPYITEFAGIRTNSSFEEIDRLEIQFKVPIKLPAFITKLTGIVDEDLKDCPTFGDSSNKLASFFFGTSSMYAYNLPFDRTMLVFELKRLSKLTKFPWSPNHTDVLATVKALRLGLANNKFETVYNHIFETKANQAHRAMQDTEELLRLCQYLHSQGKL